MKSIYLNTSFVPKLMGFFNTSREELVSEISRCNPGIVKCSTKQPDPPVLPIDVSEAVRIFRDSESVQLTKVLTKGMEPDIVQSIDRAVAIQRGIERESTALDQLSFHVRKCKTLFKKELTRIKLGNDEEVSVLVGGRVDGFLGDRVVETKNRRNRLFGYVPEYENIQIQLYLFLTDCESCIHLENYDGAQNETIVHKKESTLEHIRERVGKRLLGLI